MKIVLTLLDTDKGRALAEVFRKKNEEESAINKKIVLGVFRENIVSEDPLVIEMIPRVRINTSFAFVEMKDGIEKLGGVRNKDFKLEMKG